MKKLLLMCLFVGCGKKIEKVVGPTGTSCTVTQTVSGATITCTDGTSASVVNGVDGSPGIGGLPGLDGDSCTVSQLVNGALISCGSSSAVVMNGEDALSGMIGIAEVLNPCSTLGNHEEVLLKLSTGQVLALYDGGATLDRLTLLIPNTVYTTTDQVYGTCTFSVNAQGNLN